MLIYIHGFGGSGLGVKATIFRKHFTGSDFLAPSISYVPDLAIQTLEELIEIFTKKHQTRVGLVGSSLGGYYAMYLSNKYSIKSVLINPSTMPIETLDKSRGYAPNFYDKSSFEWSKAHLEMLKKYEVEEINYKLYFLLTQKGDELLDYKVAVDKLQGAKIIIEEGGSHSFDGIQKHFKVIEDFLLK